jgi:hypothetical protein
VGRDLRRAVLVLSGGGVVCMRDIFISSEIWDQDKIYILIDTLPG